MVSGSLFQSVLRLNERVFAIRKSPSIGQLDEIFYSKVTCDWLKFEKVAQERGAALIQAFLHG